MQRPPAVAGQFYAGQRELLLRDVESYLEASSAPQEALACVVPHAGLMYSGHVAGAVYARVRLPPSVIVLGPNHRGLGAPLAIMSEGAWQTPLGEVELDAALAAACRHACNLIEEDPLAHSREHSLEVQLPFLQRLKEDFRLVPIAIGTGRYEPLEELGRALARVIAGRSPRPLLVASTDLNHYESDAVGRKKDQKAIDRILALDPKGLYETVHREQISMCGYGPTVAVLTAARELGARRAELIRYATSGDITGDRSAVVGYAGILIQ